MTRLCHYFTHWLAGQLAVALLLLFPTVSLAQDTASTAWFGVPLPPGFTPHESPVILGSDYGPLPAPVPAGESAYTALEGETIFAELQRIVAISLRSEADNEVGSGQLWGRITGLPSGDAVQDLAEASLRQAGLDRVQRQRFDQDSGATLWLPMSWEVRIHGDESFGAGSRDVILESAMPAGGTVIPEQGLTAPLVFVGTARAAELAYIDVRGKIAVQHVTPRGHLFLERGPTRAKAQQLIDRGAVAVFNIIDYAGNMRMRDISNCGGPCFNIGGQDGRFLEQVFDAAAAGDQEHQILATLNLSAEERGGMRGSNVIAILDGDSEENIIINAHADGWFDGANDNGDGLSIMLALARHFASTGTRPARTLVFVSSAGHHTRGLNGPDQLVALNPELMANNVLTINLEHVASRHLNPARTDTLGVRDVITDAGEGFLMNGMNRRSATLEALIREGGLRYGLNFVSQASTYHAGDNPDVDGTLFQLIQGNPLYHTSGETLATISVPGLEKVARFVAWFVGEASHLPRDTFFP